MEANDPTDGQVPSVAINGKEELNAMIESVSHQGPNPPQALPIRSKQSGPSASASETHGKAASVASPKDPGGRLSDAEDDASASVISTTKKKNKRKPASKRGLGKPTGFEEYHTEGPLTPEEWRQDQDRYNPNLPFIDRILTAIHHFEQTKRLTSERRDVFYKYLKYGGVDVGPNMFQGGLDQENLDPAAVAAAKARTSIAADKKDLDTVTSLWAVDFLACMRGFLSRRAIDTFPTDTEAQVSMVTTTLERFMDYLLNHSVCEEYRDSILATRQFCRDATSEIWDLVELRRWLPGQYNIACSTLFGGFYAQIYDGKTSWEPETFKDPVFVGFTTETASQILKYAVAGAATEDVYESFVAKTQTETNELEVVEVREMVWFEITSITPPTKECNQLYKSTKDFRAVGRVTARPWQNPAAPPEDLTPEEREILRKGGKLDDSEPDDADGVEYIFFVEEMIQKKMRVGTKIEATVSKVNCGLWFFDSVLAVLPSFDEFLVNEMVEGYKEPKPKKGAWNYVEEDVGDGDGDEDRQENSEGGEEVIDTMKDDGKSIEIEDGGKEVAGGVV